MSAIMISIRPEWCEKIASAKKTVEVRKTRPKIDPPFKCYIYCTKPKKILHAVYTKQDYRGYFADEDYDKIPENYKTFVKVPDGSSPFCCPPYTGKIIGEFTCSGFDEFTPTDKGVMFKRFSALYQTKLSLDEIRQYLNGKKGYGWRISDLIIYEEPKILAEFLKPCFTPEMPYCPECTAGGEYVSDTEAEFYRTDGECNTEWRCLNYLRRPPQSWCYVMEV